MRTIAVVAAALTITCPALAGTSAWHETTGGKLRLVTHSTVDADGVLRGVVEIDLDDGWKTYWKEPGESGVAPQVSLGNAGADNVALHFPAPERFDDGVSQWAGYEGHVRLPVAFNGMEDLSTSLTLDVFLGVCETICVPVQASLTVRPGDDSGPIYEAQIDAAFASLPAKPHGGFEATRIFANDNTLIIEVDTSEGEVPDLFLAGRGGLMLATPQFERSDTGGTFTARIVHRGKDDALQADYTLVSGERAVSGFLETD